MIQPHRRPAPGVRAKRLGKLAARYDPRTLRLAARHFRSAAQAPASCSWGDHVAAWGMMLNDQLGDCAIATPGHLVEMWAGVVVPDSAVLTAYEAVAGYDPATGENDNGCVELDVLNYWHKTGIAGHTVEGYLAVSPADHDMVKLATYEFGGLFIGLNLPLSAQSQNNAGQTWDAVGGMHGRAGTWGGHAVPVVAYDADGLTCVTWGALQRMTWAFWDAYCDEAYAAASRDWVATSKAPNGLDWPAVVAEFDSLGGTLPVPAPSPIVPPPPIVAPPVQPPPVAPPKPGGPTEAQVVVETVNAIEAGKPYPVAYQLKLIEAAAVKGIAAAFARHS